MRAFVLIDCIAQDARRIADKLRSQEGVILADVVNGPKPIVAVVEGKDSNGLAGTILFNIRKMEGVTDLTVYLTEPDAPGIGVYGGSKVREDERD